MTSAFDISRLPCFSLTGARSCTWSSRALGFGHDFAGGGWGNAARAHDGGAGGANDVGADDGDAGGANDVGANAGGAAGGANDGGANDGGAGAVYFDHAAPTMVVPTLVGAKGSGGVDGGAAGCGGTGGKLRSCAGDRERRDRGGVVARRGGPPSSSCSL